MQSRNGIRRWRGRCGEILVRLRVKQTRVEISDRGSSLRNEGIEETHARNRGEMNYLVFRALGVENGKEELAVSVLALGELEGSKDLSKRGRGCLARVRRENSGGRARDGPAQEDRKTSRGCAGGGGRTSSWLGRRERGGMAGRRGEGREIIRAGLVSKYKYAK